MERYFYERTDSNNFIIYDRKKSHASGIAVVPDETDAQKIVNSLNYFAR